LQDGFCCSLDIMSTDSQTETRIDEVVREADSKVIEINGFEIGNGHLRAQFAVMEAIERRIKMENGEKDGIVCRSFNLSQEDLRVSKVVAWLDKMLGVGYRNPGILVGISNSQFMKDVGNKIAFKMITTIIRTADQGELDDKHPAKLRVAVHPHVSTATTSAAVHVVLDPYADLYFTDHQEAVILVPDMKTGLRAKELDMKNVVVVGPMVARSVVEARERFDARLKELTEDKKGLRIMISTGGNMTHGKEIAGLTRAYLKAITEGANIEKIYVMVSQSEEMRDEFNKILEHQPGWIRDKFQLIYSEDRMVVVQEADKAMGEADVIHAKTGEMVYSVGGGKVFETFSKIQGPSLAVQEVSLREYVETQGVMKDENGKKIAALAEGMTDYEKEVENILWQLADGMLVKRMKAGLKVPVDGADVAASIVYNILKGDQSEKFRRKTVYGKLVEVVSKRLGLKGRVLGPTDEKLEEAGV